MLDILAEHKQRQQEVAQDLFSDDYRVCGGVKPLPDTSIENKNTEFATAAGLPHIRIHDFRHSHVSVLVNEGINISEIARRLGHADITMTINIQYGHSNPSSQYLIKRLYHKNGQCYIHDTEDIRLHA